MTPLLYNRFDSSKENIEIPNNPLMMSIFLHDFHIKRQEVISTFRPEYSIKSKNLKTLFKISEILIIFPLTVGIP